MRTVVETINLKKIYKQGKIDVPALRGIDIEIEEGDFVSILGPSGSGKSTLLNMIGALDLPTEGKVLINGRDITKLNKSERAELRRNVGFVFQFFNLVPRLSAFKNVELSMSIKNIGKSERREKVEEILNLVGLGERVKHRPRELSGGEQQRVAIARALALDPEFLLMDEPTGNVDLKTSNIIMDLVKELNKKYNRTIIIITHDPLVAKQTERIIYLVDGKVENDPEILKQLFGGIISSNDIDLKMRIKEGNSA
jgi:putative ABC transport system ATP-binding protein